MSLNKSIFSFIIIYTYTHSAHTHTKQGNNNSVLHIVIDSVQLYECFVFFFVCFERSEINKSCKFSEMNLSNEDVGLVFSEHFFYLKIMSLIKICILNSEEETYQWIIYTKAHCQPAKYGRKIVVVLTD